MSLDIRPFNVKNHRLLHTYLASATVASTSIAAPGSGLSWVPVYAWGLSSAVASLTVTNGTSGTAFFGLKTVAGVVVEVTYWDETYLANKPLVIASDLNGGGTFDFHVWYTIRRTGAGTTSGTTL